MRDKKPLHALLQNGDYQAPTLVPLAKRVVDLAIAEPPRLSSHSAQDANLVNGIFKRIGSYRAAEVRQKVELRMRMEKILSEFETLTPDQRALFFGKLYDAFASTYDDHMGRATRHYKAIKKVMTHVAYMFELPVIDPTAGTCEPLKYFLEFFDSRHEVSLMLKKTGCMAPSPERAIRRKVLRAYRNQLPHSPSSDDVSVPYAVANEISKKMLAIGRRKLSAWGQPGVGFDDQNALALGDMPEYRGRFKSVLVAQTFHLLSEEDKMSLIFSIRNLAADGAKVYVFEEDPFRISQTDSIESVALFLRSIVLEKNYMRNKSDFIAKFTNNGFRRLESRAVEPIDDQHAMRVFVFEPR